MRSKSLRHNLTFDIINQPFACKQSQVMRASAYRQALPALFPIAPLWFKGAYTAQRAMQNRWAATVVRSNVLGRRAGNRSKITR